MEEAQEAARKMVEERQKFLTAKQTLSLSPPEEEAGSAYERMEEAAQAFDELREEAMGLVDEALEIIEKYAGDHSHGSSRGHKADYYRDPERPCCFESYADNLNKLADLAEQIEKQRGTVVEKLDRLDKTLSDDCSSALADGMKEEIGDYKQYLIEGLPDMVAALKTRNQTYISRLQTFFRNDLRVNLDDAAVQSLNWIKDTIKYATISDEAPADSNQNYSLLQIANGSLTINEKFYPDINEDMFRFSNLGGRYADLYFQLACLYAYGDDGGADKKTFEDFLGKILDEIEYLKKGFDVEIAGASQIPQEVAANLPSALLGKGKNTAEVKDLKESDAFSKLKKENTAAREGLSEAMSLFESLANVADAVTERALLLTYAAGMFSSYASPQNLGGSSQVRGESMTGIPFGTDVNYMLGAEQEYLFHGSLNAEENLKAVTNLLFMTRFVFNYISTFQVTSVKLCLAGVEAAFAAIPPFHLILKELARVNFALAESCMDVSALRQGKAVPLLKNDQTWQFLRADFPGGSGGGPPSVNASESAKEALKGKVPGYDSGSKSWSSIPGNLSTTMNRSQEIDKTVRENPLTSKDLKTMTDQDVDLEKGEYGEKSGSPGRTAETVDELKDKDMDTGQASGLMLDYSDYLGIYLLLFVKSDTLALRISDLIAINLTNYSGRVGADEEKMKTAALYDMSAAKTYFAVTSTVNLRFLFLSMPLFRRSGAGVIPPRSVPVSVTDYRGY